MIDFDSIALNLETAYIKKSPILTPKDMPRLLQWNPLSEEWRRALQNSFWYSKFKGNLANIALNSESLPHIQRILILRDRLLSFGGEEACMPVFEEDLEKIFSRGQFWYGDRVKKRKGKPNQCHRNSAYLWSLNRDKTKIVTGYALSEDGMWRQHSWLINIRPRKNIIIETTVPRIAYYGFVMNEEECETFLWQ